MCDPIVGTILSVAGGVVGGLQKQAYAEQLRQAELNAFRESRNARQQEQERQRGFETEAQDNWTQTRQQLSADTMGAQETAAQDAFAQTLAGMNNSSPEGFLLSGQESSSEALQGEIAKRTNKASQEARARISALAKLSGQDTAGQQRALSLGNNADFLTTLNGLRQGSLGASQFEQNIPAEYVAPPNMLFADILSGAGGTISGMSGPGGMFGSKLI